MTRVPVPIYDEGAAVACTIDDADVPGRMALLERMRAALGAVERADHGMRLHFPAAAAIEADVRTFARDEKRCCQFFGFAVEAAGDEVVLRWDVPPSATPILTRLLEYFEGDGPVEDLRGLL